MCQLQKTDIYVKCQKLFAMIFKIILFLPFFLTIYGLETDLNVGTVLFSEADLMKECWSSESIALLTSRMIMEDVLPSKSVMVIDSNEFVQDIVKYFRKMLQVVRKQSQGRKKYISLTALSDLLGGYLHSVVLPVARYSYYSGRICFAAVQKLIDLYEELKWFLKTSGQGWTEPTSECDISQFAIDTVTIEDDVRNQNACSPLIYHEQRCFKGINKKRAPNPDQQQPEVLFPLPFFDAQENPNSIAMPFKSNGLKDIESKQAASIVLKYYIAATKCLQFLQVKPETTEIFQNNLFTWIEDQVMPKLTDDKLYAAFGGILRVRETLRSLGATKVDIKDWIEPKNDNRIEDVASIPENGKKMTHSNMVLMAMLIFIFVWFLLGTLFICYRIRAHRLKGKNQIDSNGRKSQLTSTNSSTKSHMFPTKSSTSRTSIDDCKCVSSENKSIDYSSSSDYDMIAKSSSSSKKMAPSSDYDFVPVSKKDAKKQKSNSKSKHIPPCVCDDSPAIIDTKHSVKMLPSIAEISENSSRLKEDKDNKKNGDQRKISFDESPRKKFKICVPSNVDVETCPSKQSEKETNRSKSKCSVRDSSCPSGKKDSSTNDGTTEESSGTNTDTTSLSQFNPQLYTCHTSIAGNYEIFRKNNPYIFGYDFHTSSSDCSSRDSDDQENGNRTSS